MEQGNLPGDLDAWLALVLPIEAERAFIRRAEAPLRIDEDGYVRVGLLAALRDSGAVTEVIEEQSPLVHLEDLVFPERTRAFLAGWAAALRAQLENLDWDASARLHELLTGHEPALDDLDLTSETDFADAIRSAPWRDSDPDVTIYPSLERVPAPIAQDRDRERRLASDPDDSAMQSYLEWLEERGDPRGRLGGWMQSPSIMDARRARQLLRAERGYLAGPFPIGEPGETWHDVELDWQAGFVHEARVILSLDAEGPAPEQLLCALFQLPAARLLRRLRIEVDPDADEDPDRHELARVGNALTVPSDSLRALELVRHPTLHTLPEDEAALRRIFPKLEQLSLLPRNTWGG